MGAAKQTHGAATRNVGAISLVSRGVGLHGCGTGEKRRATRGDAQLLHAGRAALAHQRLRLGPHLVPAVPITARVHADFSRLYGGDGAPTPVLHAVPHLHALPDLEALQEEENEKMRAIGLTEEGGRKGQ